MKKAEPLYLKIDSRNRVSLTKLVKKISPIYKAYAEDDRIVLEPVLEVPAEEAWLFMPENKHILQRLKRSLKQEATHSFDSIKKLLKK